MFLVAEEVNTELRIISNNTEEDNTKIIRNWESQSQVRDVGYWYIVVICQNQLNTFIHVRRTRIADYSGINYLPQALAFLTKIKILSIVSGSKTQNWLIF